MKQAMLRDRVLEEDKRNKMAKLFHRLENSHKGKLQDCLDSHRANNLLRATRQREAFFQEKFDEKQKKKLIKSLMSNIKGSLLGAYYKLKEHKESEMFEE